jgi:hypothetical protein
VLAAAWAIFIAFAYPGLMSVDSFDQLGEGRAWFFTDSHPPIMAALWGLLDRVVPGPFGMLVLQSGCFLAGCFLILRRALRPTAAAIAAGILLLFPPIGAALAVIWKDCLMAGFLVLGIALVLDARRGVRLAGLGLLLLATALRYNAFAATLPLVVLLFEWRPSIPALRRYAIAFAAWLAITVLAIGLDRMLVAKEMHFWSSSFALVDITGTLAKLEPDLPDAELAPLLAPTQIQVDRDYHATIRAHYTPGDFIKVVGPPPGLWNVTLSGTEPLPAAQRDAIGHAWHDIVLGHPAAYLRYRFDSFAEVLGLRRKFAGTVLLPRHWQHRDALARFAIDDVEPPLAAAGETVAWWFVHRTPFARPWFYAVLALALLGFARRDREVLALLASGLLLESSLVFLAVTPDYRYSHWLTVTTCLALLLLVARRARR